MLVSTQSLHAMGSVFCEPSASRGLYELPAVWDTFSGASHPPSWVTAHAAVKTSSAATSHPVRRPYLR